MPAFWLYNDEYSFPDPALASSDGLLAVGGDLAPERLLEAYKWGIFPWYNEDDPILWWSPDPRFVLFPAELRVTKSMRPYLNQPKFQISFDQSFEQVMRACQSTRRAHQPGSWIHEDMIEAYTKLHFMGYAHSVEVWQEGQLVGGLYGICLGKIFFGESMFARVSNASKFGFIRLVHWLQARDFQLIDCQQETTHLVSLGARAISRTDFMARLQDNLAHYPIQPGTWSL
jgi:leucyl/phenylalanyl-tRNA--protein transferase